MNDEGRRTNAQTRDTQQAVDLHIQELVLYGFDAGDRYRIGAAMEAELARLVAEQGVPPSLAQGGEIADFDGGAFEIASGSQAEAIGTAIAGATYGGLDP